MKRDEYYRLFIYICSIGCFEFSLKSGVLSDTMASAHQCRKSDNTTLTKGTLKRLQPAMKLDIELQKYINFHLKQQFLDSK
jgi:hypothetical protein